MRSSLPFTPYLFQRAPLPEKWMSELIGEPRRRGKSTTEPCSGVEDNRKGGLERA